MQAASNNFAVVMAEHRWHTMSITTDSIQSQHNSALMACNMKRWALQSTQVTWKTCRCLLQGRGARRGGGGGEDKVVRSGQVTWGLFAVLM